MLHLNRLAKAKLVVSFVVNYCCKQKMLEETETEETFDLFGHIFVIDDILIGGKKSDRLPPPPNPPGYANVLGSFILEMRKLLATSDAEFNSSNGAGMGLKSSGTKAAVIFAFSRINLCLDVKEPED